MRLEPANIVCPACGNGNYMRHLIGKNVGYLDMKCSNCNSYFNFDELYKRHIGEVLEPKLKTNADRIRAMTDEELADFLAKNRGGCRALTTESYVCNFYDDDLNTDCEKCWLDWLRKEAGNG